MGDHDLFVFGFHQAIYMAMNPHYPIFIKPSTNLAIPNSGATGWLYQDILPSGKRLHNYGKTPFFTGKINYKW
jgi:hypothetical protein